MVLIISKHDASVVSVYVTVNYIITAFSVIIDIVVMLVIYRFTPISSRGYRNHLLTVMIIGLCSTLYLCFFFQPLTTAPLPCIYTQGIIKSLINLDTHWAFTIFVTIVALNAPPLVNCFIYRHQCVLLPGSRFRLSIRSIIALTLFIYFYFLSHGVGVYFMRYDAEKQDAYLKNKLRGFTLMEIRRIACYDTAKFLIFFEVTCVTCGSCLLFLSAICFDIFRVLAWHKSISSRTKEFHRKMTLTLIIQSGMMAANIICPLCLFFVQFSFSLNNDILPLIALEVTSAYSATFGILLIAMTNTYRSGISSIIINRRVLEGGVTLVVPSTPFSPISIREHSWSDR